MSYQFGHIECYARSPKRGYNIHDIRREAERESGYCDHVANPEPPTIVYGCTPREAVELAEEWGEQERDARGRKLRRDAPVMLGGVLSYPRGGDHWEAFKNMSVRWLTEKYGSRLVSVIEHQDEANPHLHFYCVPRPGESFDVLHEGRAASAAIKRKTAQNGGQHHASEMKMAYNRAMRGWQDELHAGVGVHMGLARMGPRRSRLEGSGQWKAFTRALKAIVDAEMIARQANDNRRIELDQREIRLTDDVVEARGFLDSKEDELKAREAELAAKFDQYHRELSEAKNLLRSRSDEIRKERDAAHDERERLDQREAYLDSKEAEIDANTPDTIKAQNRAFKAMIHALVAGVPEAQLRELGKTMSREQRQHLMAVMESQGKGYSR
uniref:Plasmid recombination enzyme n=1 Tax=uncultured prokaryote TaxID=198431 RepID=A0A0H5Q0M1_9ZZZZ|nr:hypothetical protein [uncultured prokaryote]